MKLDIFCLSDKGCVRSGNQDMAGAGLHLIRDDQTSFVHDLGDGKSFFLLIADGMGGHQHGEMASSYTLEELRDMLFDGSRDWSAPEQLLSGEIRRISDDLNRKSAEMQLDKPMGCTLTGFVLAGGRTLLVNVGDSRSYRLRAGMLRRLTVDQTIHERDMVPFPQGKAIYSCIGGGISPETVIEDYAGRLLPGDRLLICSDGLTDMVSENDIELFLAEGRPTEAGSLLVEHAKAAGGLDNVSVIVADLIEDEPDAGDTAHAGSVALDAGATIHSAAESLAAPVELTGPAENGAPAQPSGPVAVVQASDAARTEDIEEIPDESRAEDLSGTGSEEACENC